MYLMTIGALTNKAIVRVGVRELDHVQEYTGHPESNASLENIFKST